MESKYTHDPCRECDTSDTCQNCELGAYRASGLTPAEVADLARAKQEGHMVDLDEAIEMHPAETCDGCKREGTPFDEKPCCECRRVPIQPLKPDYFIDCKKIVLPGEVAEAMRQAEPAGAAAKGAEG